MLIDWFTVIAQVLNFLILVWLLKRFLYRPILNAIDARERKVAAELADAASKEAEAKKEKEEYKRKNEEFDQQLTAFMSKAKDEAKSERQRLLEDARKEASDFSLKQREALKAEIQNLNREISHRTEQEVLAITRKVLKDLAGENLEDHIIQVFVQRLHELKGKNEKQLTSVLKASPRHVSIRTAFDLSNQQQNLISEAVKETFGIEIQPDFKTAPNLISGIELTADGQKIAWSVADYLSSLEKSMDEVLQEKSTSATGLSTEPQIEGSITEADKSEPEGPRPEPDPLDEDSKSGSKQELKFNPNSRQRADEHGA